MSITQRFKVKADNGDEYTLVCTPSADIPAGHHCDPKASIPSRLGTLTTTDGLIVTPIDSETFKIIEFDQIVRKV